MKDVLVRARMADRVVLVSWFSHAHCLHSAAFGLELGFGPSILRPQRRGSMAIGPVGSPSHASPAFVGDELHCVQAPGFSW